MIATYPLEDVWPIVKPKIKAIRERYADHCDWHEDDVYLACSQRLAILFNNDEDDSFAVVKIKVRHDEKILFIWIACGENGKRDRNLSFLREIARSVGASRIEMESPRKGFDRMSGWKRGMTTYSMEA